MTYPTYEQHSDEGARQAQAHREVQVLAYSLWEHAGRPAGLRTPGEPWQDFFWRRAEEEVRERAAWRAILHCVDSPC
jgi:hypothetical protein